MQVSKILHHYVYIYIHLFLLTINFLIAISIAENLPDFCGKTQIKPPFFNPNSTSSSPLNNLILCRSQKLYFRTSLGLFPISSVNYTTKTIIISHQFSSSSSQKFISPSVLSSGFRNSPYHTNSLLLFNCSKQPQPTSDFLRNCTGLRLLGADSEIKETKSTSYYYKYSSCLFIEDVEKLGDMEFHPKVLDCSHYIRAHSRRSLGDGDHKEVELGTRISYDIPDHVPDICKECEKPNGNCGVGLRCICHAHECKDKLVNTGGNLNSVGNSFYSCLSFTILMIFWKNYP